MLRRICLPAVLLSFAANAGADSLAATYELRSKMGGEERTAEFVLVRTDTIVEVQDKASGIVERWERDPTGRIFYSRIFLDAGKVIDFQPADFASAGVSDRWETIRSVLPVSSLGELREVGHGRTSGMQTDRYRGTVEGAKVAVEWLSDAGIPARVTRQGAHVRTDLKLTAVARGDAALATMVPASRLEAFERIDFADLGDREGDPVVESLLAQSGMALHAH